LGFMDFFIILSVLLNIASTPLKNDKPRRSDKTSTFNSLIANSSSTFYRIRKIKQNHLENNKKGNHGETSKAHRHTLLISYYQFCGMTTTGNFLTMTNTFDHEYHRKTILFTTSGTIFTDITTRITKKRKKTSIQGFSVRDI
jgi:hypothetical protein